MSKRWRKYNRFVSTRWKMKDECKSLLVLLKGQLKKDIFSSSFSGCLLDKTKRHLFVLLKKYGKNIFPLFYFHHSPASSTRVCHQTDVVEFKFSCLKTIWDRIKGAALWEITSVLTNIHEIFFESKSSKGIWKKQCCKIRGT